MGVDLRIRVFQ